MLDFQAGDFVYVDDKHFEGYGYIVGFHEGNYMRPIINLVDSTFSFCTEICRVTKANPDLHKQIAFNNKAVVEITKEFTFDSAHYLKNYKGKCANLHGHTYKLQVTFKGIPHPETGMIMDFGEVKDLVKEIFIDVIDHQLLNDHFEFNTTAENMVVYIYTLMNVAIFQLYKNVQIGKVTLWETPTSFATYTGEVKVK